MTRGLTASRARTYERLDQLAAEATDVVFGMVVSGREDLVQGLPITRFEFCVTENLRRQRIAPQEIVEIVQVGGPGYVGDLVPLMEPGGRYLLFLRPMDSPAFPSEFGLVGSIGGWEVDVDGLAQRLDDGSPSLPDGLPLSRMKVAIREALAPQPG